MTSATVDTAGPAESARRAHDRCLDAFRDAVERTARLWRSIDVPNAPTPRLDWTAAETAAHVVGDLRDYGQALTRHGNGYMTHANPPMESPSALSAKVNARHLEEIPERDMHRLADLLEEAALAYLAVAASADLSADIATPNGLVIAPSTMTCLLLGEQVVHGLDVARSAGVRWSISAEDALLVIPGVLAIAPQYLRPSRAMGMRASYELRMRGGCRFRMAIADGTATVTAASERADCVITADPVAFLLLGFGRIGQWPQILRGRLRAGGRKPWLAMRFASLLVSP
jgi:mycothiol maleylpyruvate isomerase-like protein